MNKNISHSHQRWFYGLLIAPGLLVLWWLRSPLSDFMAWVSNRQAVTDSIQQYGMLGPLVLFVLLVLQVFVAVIPGHALILGGGYVYGFSTGVLITLSSTVLGSQIAFLIARRFGRAAVNRLAAPDRIQRWDTFSNRQGILFFFFALVLPIFPNDLMSYVAGLGTISSDRFFIANVLGRLVCAVFITLIGSNSLRMPVLFWILALIVMAAMFCAWRIYSRSSECTHLQII